MGRPWVVMVIISVTFLCSICASSVKILEIGNEEKNISLDENGPNRDKKSPDGVVTLSELSDKRIIARERSQPSLVRSSRTALHKPFLSFHSKHKPKFDPFLYMKKHKTGLFATLFKPLTGILKSFIFEIEKVLNWWDVAAKSLMGKIDEKQIPLMPNSNVAMMDREFPGVKNKILGLMGFIFEFFNLGRNADYQYPSGNICMDVKASLNRIKDMASSLIMVFKESQSMGGYSEDQLSKIQSYFESIPADQCSILNYGLVNGYKDTDLNENLNKNPNYNDDVNILKGQSYMLQIMWEYINKLPAIFLMIFENISKAFSSVNGELKTHVYKVPDQYQLRLLQQPLHYRPALKPNQLSYWSKFDIGDSYVGNEFPLNTRSSQIFKSCPVEVILDGLHAKPFVDLRGADNVANIQLGRKVLFSDAKTFNYNSPGENFRHVSVPIHDSTHTKLSLEISTILLLLKTKQLTIGDIVILNLPNDIALVGSVESNMNPITFNVIHRSASQRSSCTHGTSIWNLSHRDLSSSPQIYNDILHLTHFQMHI